MYLAQNDNKFKFKNIFRNRQTHSLITVSFHPLQIPSLLSHPLQLSPVLAETIITHIP